MASSQRNLLVIACIALVAVVAGLAAAFGWQFTSELERQFNVRAELFARSFSDRVQEKIADFDNQDEPNLDAFTDAIESLVNERARGDVIYAQVMREQIVLSEKRTYVFEQTQLDFMPLDDSLVLSQNVMPSGTAYLDVRRTLTNSPDPINPSSYVRLGFSLATLQRDILNRQLQTLLWGLGGIVLGIGLLVLIFRVWQPPQLATESELEKPHAPPVSPPPSPYVQPETAMASENNIPQGHELIQCGDLSIDDDSKSVRLGKDEIPMSPREYELLKLLTAHPGKIFSNDEIVKLVWTDDQYAIPQDVKKYIYLLRKKLEENPKRPKRLLTVRGFGYKLVDATAH